jgi:hypothetical protein
MKKALPGSKKKKNRNRKNNRTMDYLISVRVAVRVCQYYDVTLTMTKLTVLG